MVTTSGVIPNATTANYYSHAQNYNCCACVVSNGSNSTNSNEPSTNPLYYVGVALAVGNCTFVGSSYVVSKKGLLRYQARTGRPGGYSGVGYLREWLWWIGLLLLGIGETSNFLAFSFAPASLVTPLEGLSVVVSVVLAYFLLRERLNVYGQIGVFLSLIGAIIVVLLAPQDRDFASLDDLINTLTSPGVLVMIGLLLFYMIFFAAFMGPRFGASNPFVYLSIAAAGGPITVFGCKGVGLAVSDTSEGNNQFTNWITWIMILVMLLGVLTQLYYINRTLTIFPANVVTPAYFVTFTTFVLIASGITFDEYSKLPVTITIAMVCGFVVIAIGVTIISVFKDEECDWSKVRRLLLQKNPNPPPTVGGDGQSTEAGIEAGINADGTSANRAEPNSEPRKKKRTVLKLRKLKGTTSDSIKKRKLSDDEDKYSNCMVSRQPSAAGNFNQALDKTEDGPLSLDGDSCWRPTIGEKPNSNSDNTDTSTNTSARESIVSVEVNFDSSAASGEMNDETTERNNFKFALAPPSILPPVTPQDWDHYEPPECIANGRV